MQEISDMKVGKYESGGNYKMQTQISEILLQISNLIEKDQFSEAVELANGIVKQHPQLVDDRFQAELQLIMKQIEYKAALKDYNYLRSLALVYKYCEMNYAAVLDDFEREIADRGDEDKDTRLPEADTVWWCWLQGLDRAPEIVKACYQSLKGLGSRILVLDERNLQNYVELPACVEEKYRAGLIGSAHYTDLVRLEILTQRGGTWIDATTYISNAEKARLFLASEALFLYRTGNVSEQIIFDNWFMHAQKTSNILEGTKRLLYTYWERENEAKHYFIFHLMMTLACRRFQEEYQSIPLFSNEPCHVLQHELYKPYTEKRWKQICDMSNVHKLTYKFDPKMDVTGTFLEYLLGK